MRMRKAPYSSVDMVQASRIRSRISIDNSGARVLFADAQFTPVAAAAVARNETPQLIARITIGGAASGFTDYEALLATGAAAEPEQQVAGGPMFYTSGTTGDPKGVRGTLSTMPANTSPDLWHLIGAGFSQMMRVPGVTVLCGPAYHSAQWAFSFLPMMAGSATVMQHRYDSVGVLELIDRFRATTSTARP